MKYVLEIRSRPKLSQDIAEKHRILVEAISQLTAPWNWVGEPPPAPVVKTGLAAYFSFRGRLGKGLSGNVYYQFRRPFRGDAGEDDYIELKFNPDNVDYGTVVRVVFPCLIAAFDAYVGQIQPDDLIDKDLRTLYSMRFNVRSMVHRIFPVTFLDEELCRKAFNKSPSDIVSCLSGYVESAEILSGGVLIVATSAIRTADDVDVMTRSLCDLLVRE
jgi:hypothetical protein